MRKGPHGGSLNDGARSRQGLRCLCLELGSLQPLLTCQQHWQLQQLTLTEHLLRTRQCSKPFKGTRTALPGGHGCYLSPPTSFFSLRNQGQEVNSSAQECGASKGQTRDLSPESTSACLLPRCPRALQVHGWELPEVQPRSSQTKHGIIQPSCWFPHVAARHPTPDPVHCRASFCTNCLHHIISLLEPVLASHCLFRTISTLYTSPVSN